MFYYQTKAQVFQDEFDTYEKSAVILSVLSLHTITFVFATADPNELLSSWDISFV